MRSDHHGFDAPRGWTAAELHALLAPGEPSWAAELDDDEAIIARLLDDDHDGRFLAVVDRFLAAT
jgi:hypothetical protein